MTKDKELIKKVKSEIYYDIFVFVSIVVGIIGISLMIAYMGAMYTEQIIYEELTTACQLEFEKIVGYGY